MNLRALICRLLAPRYIYNAGAISDESAARLAHSRPGAIVRVESCENIHLLPTPPVHLHIHPHTRKPTPAMGPTLRRYK